MRDVLRWKLTSRPARWPREVPLQPVVIPPAPTGGGLVVTWIGHSTFLIRACGAAWLTDPVFSNRIGPFRGLGPRRVVPPAIPLAALPPIDGVLLSHDHYDHCDLPSLRALAAANEGLAVVSPLNYRALLKAAGADRNLVELDWWQSCEGPGQTAVELVPARHWCRRSPWGTNVRLWGGFFVRGAGRALYFAGDSGHDPALMAQIADRCGAPDIALLPIGAYEPRWFMSDAHMNPAEAVACHRALRARRSVGMHWGAFQLTDEGYHEPVEELAIARDAAGIAPGDFVALLPGESLVID